MAEENIGDVDRAGARGTRQLAELDQGACDPHIRLGGVIADGAARQIAAISRVILTQLRMPLPVGNVGRRTALA